VITIDVLLERTGLSVRELAERARLSHLRAEAIADGRWTPSPEERQRIAEVFSLPAEEISWGHTLNPRNLRYRRFGHPEVYEAWPHPSRNGADKKGGTSDS